MWLRNWNPSTTEYDWANTLESVPLSRIGKHEFPARRLRQRSVLYRVYSFPPPGNRYVHLTFFRRWEKRFLDLYENTLLFCLPLSRPEETAEPAIFLAMESFLVYFIVRKRNNNCYFICIYIHIYIYIYIQPLAFSLVRWLLIKIKLYIK